MLLLTQHLTPPPTPLNNENTHSTISELNIKISPQAESKCFHCGHTNSVNYSDVVVMQVPIYVAIHKYCPHCNKSYISLLSANGQEGMTGYMLLQPSYIENETSTIPYVSIPKLLTELNMCISGNRIYNKSTYQPIHSSSVNSFLSCMVYNMQHILHKLVVSYLYKILQLVENHEFKDMGEEVGKEAEMRTELKNLITNMLPTISYLHYPQCLNTILFYDNMLDGKLLTKEHKFLFEAISKVNLLKMALCM